MKRALSFLLSLMVLIGAFAYRPPKAKALALEAYTIGQIVGMILVGCGFTWVGVNMAKSDFGESVARELQDYLDETQPGKVIDVFFGGKTPKLNPGPNGHGAVMVVSAAVISSVVAFGRWLYDKYKLGNGASAPIVSLHTITDNDGNVYELTIPGDVDGSHFNPLRVGSILYTNTSTEDKKISFGSYDFIFGLTSDRSTIGIECFNGKRQIVVSSKSVASYDLISFVAWESSVYVCSHTLDSSNLSWERDFKVYGVSSTDINDSSLNVTADEVQYPDTETLPEGQGIGVEFPGVDADDLPAYIDAVVPEMLTNPEFVPTLTPTELPAEEPEPIPGEEEMPEPAPAGASIIDTLFDVWRKIKAFPDTLVNILKSVFEPDPSLLTDATSTFTNKFGWLETVHRFGTDLFGMTADSKPPVIYIHLEDATGKYNYGGTEKALDMSWYQPYKEDVDRLLSGFMWISFLWLVFKRASSIIQGGEMVTEYNHDIGQGYRRRRG